MTVRYTLLVMLLFIPFWSRERVNSIAVLSTLGELVATQQLDGFTTQLSLDVSGLSSGIYVLKFVHLNGKVATKTIVVQ